jgi:hypothetical protein
MDLLSIIQNIPEVLIRQLQPKTADTLRDLQYRFADRFKNIMFNLLKETNLKLVSECDPIAESQPTKNSGYIQNIKGYFNLFKTPAIKPVENTLEAPVENRLKLILNKVESDTLKEMLKMIASTPHAESLELKKVYALANVIQPSNPKVIHRTSNATREDTQVIGHPELEDRIMQLKK